eukprot:GGOE01014308.1.p1 GENE.GGOE01014308.1~~GGOE01014308.1.p1  ORF type:complete len:224 (+),score=16.55 GGOE01014308.1:37-708(+)
MPRPKPKWEMKISGWGLGCFAVILSVISLYLFLSSRSGRRERRRINGDGRRSANSNHQKSYIGWKVLLGFECFTEGFEIRPCDIDALHHLAATCDLYILKQVSQDYEEDVVRRVCEHADLIKNGLDPCKILFCSTRKGKEAIGRQLSPALYIDNDETTIGYLAAHLPHLTLIDPSLPSPSTSSVADSTTDDLSSIIQPHPSIIGVMMSPSVADFTRYLSRHYS